MIVGVLFVISIAIGTYLNKLIPNSGDIIEKLAPTVNYYNSQMSVVSTVTTNLKSDLLYIGILSVLALFVVTMPVAVAVFLLKGLSLGYTINSCIIALGAKSTGLVIVLIMKNFVIIPGSVILLVIALNYMREVVNRVHRSSSKKVSYLSKRYAINAIILIIFCTGLQALLNAVCVFGVKFLL
jgi:stage II sporulation protein M